MLNVIYAECHMQAHYPFMLCHYAEWHYTECHYAECHGAQPLAQGERNRQKRMFHLLKNVVFSFKFLILPTTELFLEMEQRTFKNVNNETLSPTRWRYQSQV